MTDTVTICLDRVRERQYQLSVGEWTYGEWMSYTRAKDLGEHIYSVLLDLQEIGIIADNVRISFVDNVNDQSRKDGTRRATNAGETSLPHSSAGMGNEDGGP